MTLTLLKSVTGRVLIESHRGAEKLAPENSWRGLELGHSRGADLIEVDVQLSADGIAFLHHPYTLPDGRACRDVAWAELSMLPFDGEPLPRLESVLEWACDVGAHLALDLKTAFTPQTKLTNEVVRLVQKKHTLDRVLLLAWDHNELVYAKRFCPEIITRALIRGRVVDLPALIQAVGADCVSLSYDLIRPGDIEEMHTHGVAVVLADLWQPDFDFARESGVDVVSWGDPGEAKRKLSD